MQQCMGHLWSQERDAEAQQSQGPLSLARPRHSLQPHRCLCTQREGLCPDKHATCDGRCRDGQARPSHCTTVEPRGGPQCLPPQAQHEDTLAPSRLLAPKQVEAAESLVAPGKLSWVHPEVTARLTETLRPTNTISSGPSEGRAGPAGPLGREATWGKSRLALVGRLARPVSRKYSIHRQHVSSSPGPRFKGSVSSGVHSQQGAASPLASLQQVHRLEAAHSSF